MGQNFSRVGYCGSKTTQVATEVQSLVANAAPEPKSRHLKAVISKTARNSQTVKPEGYVRAALLEVNGCAPEQIFRPLKRFPKPQLRKGVTNRILTFPGTFNLPYMGHNLLLTHTFFRSNLENVVAAIISPNSTKSTKKKLKNEADALILTRKERVSLWNDPFLTPWSWVNPYMHQKSGDFENALLNATEADGFQIEFVLVVGGDHIDQAAACNDTSLLEPTVVFSDGLQSFPRAPNGAPLHLPGYREWQKSELPHTRLLAKLKQGKLSALAMLYLMYPLEIDNGFVVLCKLSLQEAALKIQFVPARHVVGAGVESDLSATGIRAVIQEVDPAQRVLALTNLALNPQMLSDLVHEKKKKMALKDAK
jgi:hypothetical protein